MTNTAVDALVEYPAVEWLRSNRLLPKGISPLGREVAHILGGVWRGIYHLDSPALRRVEWANPDHMHMRVWDSLSTYDRGDLTELVIACHDACIRLNIAPSGPRGLRLLFSRRIGREGAVWDRHPTIEQATADWRKS